MNQVNTSTLPNYEVEIDLCVKFLSYKNSISGNSPFIEQLRKISQRESEILQIRLDEISKIIDKNFADRVEENILRYISLFYEAADRLMPQPSGEVEDKTRADTFLSSRVRMMALDNNLVADKRKKLPSDLTRRYEIIIHPFENQKPLTVREVKSHLIGRLITIKGMATRITNVRPLIFVATYTCDACGHEFYKSVRSKEFMPMIMCENPNCVSAEKIFLQTRGSRFLKYQQLTIQEIPETVPFGGIPRTMNINLRSSGVRQCVAGDVVEVSGVFLPMQYSGFRQMKAGLTANTAFEATHIRKLNKSYETRETDAETLRKVKRMAEDPDCYSKLARSIAPEIYGLVDVKKALLLLMVGGASKKTKDGLNIRGDINILLMGDPGVAKSQLLKHISVIAPRAVYTTGKGSSGVGLTAAVIKDSVTEEMVLEGGALVMADMGVCCIDEFDKMEEGDRTAIHEVMEQQTVSISKAGICTTLNARTSVLAAANPAYGRYDKKRSPEANIVLPAALMSRFDLLFVLVDSPSAEIDSDLAAHICYVHRKEKHPKLNFEPVSADFLRAYISVARTFEPLVPVNIMDNIVQIYLQMRSEGNSANAKRLLPTPRTLLSILRLSQALARLKLKNEISEEDVNEATRLMYVSQASTLSEEEEERAEQDRLAAVFSHVRDYMRARDLRSARVTDLLGSLKLKGHGEEEARNAFEHYMRLDVWMLNKSKTRLTLL